ncbi:MAG: hypothetical protein AABX39_00415 [Nanoarchaeota archaeon]
MNYKFEELMDEDKNPFLKLQVDAITRARYLLSEKTTEEQSIEDVVEALAYAEERAKFVCGFTLLNKSKETITKLKDYMLNEKYLNITSQGKIFLTEKGKTRASHSLPDEIESHF